MRRGDIIRDSVLLLALYVHALILTISLAADRFAGASIRRANSLKCQHHHIVVDAAGLAARFENSRSRYTLQAMTSQKSAAILAIVCQFLHEILSRRTMQWLPHYNMRLIVEIGCRARA